VLRIRDGRPENNGDAHGAPINTLDELGGNYLVLDIGGGQYAFYAHCVPSSFEITDGPDILFSRGIPFVLKGYIKKGESESGPGVATPVTNSMMEETSVIGFE
jgi:hypothetical protein